MMRIMFHAKQISDRKCLILHYYSRMHTILPLQLQNITMFSPVWDASSDPNVLNLQKHCRVVGALRAVSHIATEQLINIEAA